MRYFSMFSGIGGFELGIQNAFEASGETEQTIDTTGYMPDNPTDAAQKRRQPATCVGYSEIDKYAIQTYESHFEGHTNYGDATNINATDLTGFDLLVGGFPCQAFSVAGKRLGFNETRGTLFFDIARILKEKQPRHLVLENVKGLLSHDGGRTFTTIIGVLTDMGYCVEWQVLNSKDFGVPQNRERVYIVGHLGNECGRKVFPIRQNGSRIAQGKSELFGEIQAERSTTDSRYLDEPLLQDGQDGHIHQLNEPKHSNDRVYADTGISPTLNTMQGGLRQPFVAAVLTPDRLEKRQNGRRMKDNGEPAFTVTAQDRHGLFDGARIRRLTPTECERLQGFPDDWTIGSDTQRYKQCGNAVTVNVVYAVIDKLMPCLTDTTTISGALGGEI